MAKKGAGMKPKTVSALIDDLREVLREHGDMPILLSVSWLGYDDTIEVREPLTRKPFVTKKGPHSNQLMLVIWN